MKDIKVLTLFISPVIILIIGYSLVATLSNQHVTEIRSTPTNCQSIKHIAYIGLKTFSYCEDTGMVWSSIDTAWVEPGRLESERIAEYYDRKGIE